MAVMAIVCSEVGEDYFLQGIGNNLFTDGGEEEEGEEPNTSCESLVPSQVSLMSILCRYRNNIRDGSK